MDSPNFIDYVKIQLRSGKGGAGSSSLRREKHVPKGGPDGGDGGRGGHIILKANPQLWTLLHLKYQKHVVAENGKSGGKQGSSGAQGRDKVVEVPLGTVIKSAETGEVYAEITEENQELILFEGGKGGLGNRHFKSSVRQTPRYAQPGLTGKSEWIVLELKVLADVGLVGFPNAGKSTLLSVLSAAKPQIADYPFTTLVPNLGVVAYREDRSFVMADIPGIIEGAADGKGLGIRFLRHIERNSVLLFLISSESENPREDYQTLLKELEKYNPELLDKPRFLAISKMDLIDEEIQQKIEGKLPKNIPSIFISAIAQRNLENLKDELMKLIEDE